MTVAGSTRTSVPSADGSTPTASRSDSRRDQILAAAIELFARRGYYQTGIDDIGTAVGITGPGVYRYFKGKEDVLDAGLRLASEEIIGRCDEVVSRNLNPAQTLEELCGVYIHVMVEQPDLASVFLREAPHGPSQTSFDRTRRLHREEWVHVVSQLSPRLTENEVRVVVAGIGGLLGSALRSRGVLGVAELNQMLMAMIDAVVRGTATTHSRTLQPSQMTWSSHGTEAVPASENPDQPAHRRVLILNSAADQFARNGFAATGMDDIGAAAGISGPGVYRHFASKEDLLHELLAKGVEEVIRAEGERPPTGTSAPEVLLHLASDMVDTIVPRAALAAVIWNEHHLLSATAQMWIDQGFQVQADAWLLAIAGFAPGLCEAVVTAGVNALYGMAIEGAQSAYGMEPLFLRRILLSAVNDALVSLVGVELIPDA